MLEDGDERSGEADQRETTGVRRAVDGVQMLRTVLVLEEVPHGYHRLSIEAPSGVSGATHLIVCPSRCFTPDDMRPVCACGGLAMQLYAVRSMRNWGIGDFGDLKALVQHDGASGRRLRRAQPAACAATSASQRPPVPTARRTGRA